MNSIWILIMSLFQGDVGLIDNYRLLILTNNLWE